MTWTDYLHRLPGEPSDRKIAAAADVNPSTVTRWRQGQDPNPRHAVELARAFGLHPLTAFVAAGYLSLDEVDALVGADGVAASLTLDNTTTLALLEEVARRVASADI